MRVKKSVLGVALVLALIVPIGAHAAGKRLVSTDPAVFLNNVKGPNGATLTLDSDPQTLLFNPAANGAPLLAPDGHQINLEEWVGFSGTAVMKCTGRKGTQLTMTLRGLIPYGLYNVFLFGRHNEGDMPFFGVVASGPLAPVVFTANKKGNASFTTLIPPGPQSVRGTIPACLPDEFEHSFFLMYRINGQITGGDPGPPDGRQPHVSFDLWE